MRNACKFFFKDFFIFENINSVFVCDFHTRRTNGVSVTFIETDDGEINIYFFYKKEKESRDRLHTVPYVYTYPHNHG